MGMFPNRNTLDLPFAITAISKIDRDWGTPLRSYCPDSSIFQLRGAPAFLRQVMFLRLRNPY